ncbi:hypothetical protein HYY70_03480 [Candidatus Woesearchaeota archaeon]|nr:hypothetical protein [Candidatus Woesearchaeota archaeon]
MVIEGEGKQLLEQVRDISKDILTDLMEVDDRLDKLYRRLQLSEEVDKEKLLECIKEIRIAIGSIEREDTRSIEEEEILDSLITKLNYLVDITL